LLLNHSNKHLLPFLFVIVFLTGLARGIMGPANFAFISQLVEKALLPNAATWNSFSWQLSLVLGPMIAAFLYAMQGIVFTQIVIVAISIFSIALYKNVKARFEPKTNSVGNRETILSSLKAGILYVYHHPILMGALSLDMLAVLFGGVTAVMPAFADEVFKGGPQILGYLRAAPAIGSICMMLFVAGNPPLKNTGRILFLSVFLFGLFTLLFAFTSNLLLACTLLFLTGAFDAVSVVIRGTILQLYTPDHMRGRVSAVNTIFIGSSNEIGAFESGLSARLMGLIPSVIFGSSVTIVVVLIFALKFKQLFYLSLKDHEQRF
jgi:MFS family permease